MRRIYWTEVETFLQRLIDWEREHPGGTIKQFANDAEEPSAKVYSFFDRLRLRIEMSQLIINRTNAMRKESPLLKEMLRPDPSDRAKAEATL